MKKGNRPSEEICIRSVASRAGGGPDPELDAHRRDWTGWDGGCLYQHGVVGWAVGKISSVSRRESGGTVIKGLAELWFAAWCNILVHFVMLLWLVGAVLCCAVCKAAEGQRRGSSQCRCGVLDDRWGPLHLDIYLVE